MRKWMLFLVAIACFIGFGSIAKAESSDQTYNLATKVVNRTDFMIDARIALAQFQALVALNDCNPNDAQQIEAIIENLLADVDRLVDNAIVKLDKLNVVVEFEDVVVLIGGTEVTVDPIRIHMW